MPIPYAGSSDPIRTRAAYLRKYLTPEEEVPGSQDVIPAGPMGPATATSGDRTASLDDLWANDPGGATVIPNRRAGKVSIMTGAPMTDEQRQTIAQAAMAERAANPPEMMRATFRGQNFVMAPGGPRVSGAKARGFLELARQTEAERAAREEKALERQRMEEDRAEKTRQQKLAELWATEDRARRIKREESDLTRAERKDALAELAANRTRKADLFKEAISMADDPVKKGQYMEDLARSQFEVPSPNLPTGGIAGPALAAVNSGFRRANDAATSFITPGMFAPSASEVKNFQARQAKEDVGRGIDVIANDPAIVGEVAMLGQDLAEAGDLPWIQDVGDFFKFGTMEPAKIADERVRGVISKIRMAAQRAAQTYPGVTEAQIYQLLVNQLAPQLGGMAPGPARQFREAMRAPQDGPAF